MMTASVSQMHCLSADGAEIPCVLCELGPEPCALRWDFVDLTPANQLWLMATMLPENSQPQMQSLTDVAEIRCWLLHGS